MTSRNLARKLAEFAIAKKASDVVLLDLRPLSVSADFFVCCTATTDTQARAVADHLRDEAETLGSKAWHVEGKTSLSWVLVDFVDVVAHVFLPEARTFYNLERLWREADAYDVIDNGDSVSFKKRAVAVKKTAAKKKPVKKAKSVA